MLCIDNSFAPSEQSLFNLVAAFAVHELLAPLIDNVPPRSVKADYESCSHLGAEDTGDDGFKGKNKAKVSASEDEPIETVSPGAAAEENGEIEEDDEVQEVCPTKGEDQGEDDKVSVADLLASANRQAKVFAQAPGAKGKKGDAGALNFALQVLFLFCFVLYYFLVVFSYFVRMSPPFLPSSKHLFSGMESGRRRVLEPG